MHWSCPLPEFRSGPKEWVWVPFTHLKGPAERSRARRPQQLKPVCLEPVLRNKRSPRSEKPAHRI